MPNVTRPNGTVCMYNITSSTKKYRTFTFTVDTTVTLSLIQSKDGIQTSLMPNNNRNLLNSDRKLSSVSSSYIVAGADFVFISYQTSSDSIGFVSTVGPDQTPTSQNYQPVKESSSSENSTLIISVICSIVGLIIVGLAVVGFIFWFWIRKYNKANKNSKIQQINNVKVKKENETQPWPVNQSKLKLMKFYQLMRKYRILNFLLQQII